MAKIPVNIEDGTLARYLEELGHLDLLTLEEEQELAYRMQKGDGEAKGRFIQANLRFVVTVAKEYTHLGLPLSDLIGEGNLGLIEAVERFDPALGVRFTSYAAWWIRAAILKALAVRNRLIRIPQNQLQKLHRIVSASRRLEQEMSRPTTSAEIAWELEMSPEQVDLAMVMGRRSPSLDAPLDGDDEVRSLLDVMDSGEPSPEEAAIHSLLREAIQEALDTLDDQEAEVIRLYYGLEGRECMTLEEIGQRYGLTRERIRQIREQALSRLRLPSRSRRLRMFWESLAAEGPSWQPVDAPDGPGMMRGAIVISMVVE